MQNLGLLVILSALALFTLGTSHAAMSLNVHEFQTPGVCNLLTPQEIQSAYDFTPLYSSGLNGSGQNISIIVARGDPSLLSDLNTFDSHYNLPQLINGSNIIIKAPFGNSEPAISNWTSETALDVEVIHSLAPGARIFVVVAPNSSWLFNAINYTIYNLPVQTMSISWGASELDYSLSEINYYDGILQQARQKDISIFTASGDSGAYNSYSTLNVNFPASSPYVIGVGGTNLSISSGGAYNGETAWYGSGGGESQFFNKEPFQPNISSNRMVPDVSFNAGSATCGYANGTWYGFTGTSEAAPAWAALNSILDQKTGPSTGMLPSQLYKLYFTDPSLSFNQIDAGCNGYYCATGPYSMVSGIGSPKAFSLVQVLSQSSYSIKFESNYSGVTININGINYSAPASLNFSFGQEVKISVFPSEYAGGRRLTFESYSGYVNSNSNTVTFFVNSSGVVGVNMQVDYLVNLFDVNGNSSKQVFYSAGSSLQVSSPLYVNTSDVQYTLVGFRVDDGPILHLSQSSLVVGSPLNVTFIWKTTGVVHLVLYNVPSTTSITVSYRSFVPLLNTTRYIISGAKESGPIYPVNVSGLNFSKEPIYSGGVRFVFSNSTVINNSAVSAAFKKQIKYDLNFITNSGAVVSPGKVILSYAAASHDFNDSSVWVNQGSKFNVSSVLVNGFNLVSSPIRLNPSYNGSPIGLPASSVTVSVSSYLSIPIISGKVTLSIGNASMQNFTDFLGTVVFNDVPNMRYNITVAAYGAKTSSLNVAGPVQSIELNPGLYEEYIILLSVSLVMLSLVAMEIIHRRHRKLRNSF